CEDARGAMASVLALEHVSKEFPGVKALDDVSFSVESGEIHALLGENGAGKSTLMKVLCGIYQPDSGEIRLDGQARQFSNYREACAAGIGIVFQEFSLIPWLSVVVNVFLGRVTRLRVGLIRFVLMFRGVSDSIERMHDVSYQMP